MKIKSVYKCYRCNIILANNGIYDAICPNCGKQIDLRKCMYLGKTKCFHQEKILTGDVELIRERKEERTS